MSGLAELRNISNAAYFQSVPSVMGGDQTFTACIMLRELGPCNGTQFICGNRNGSSGWQFVRTADSNNGSTFNYTFTVYEGGVAQTLNLSLVGSVGKILIFHLVHTPGAPGAITIYVNGVEVATAATSAIAITASAQRFSIGYDVNGATAANPDLGFIAFAYATSVAFTASEISENVRASIKAEDATSGGLPSLWTYLYNVQRDAGAGVPSALRNGGTAGVQPLTVVGRTNLQLSSPPFFLGDATRVTSASGGGNVSGPVTPTTNNAIALWDGTTSDALKNSPVIVDPISGDILTPGTMNGRDIAVDGAKLDTIATGATNTPLTNVAPIDVTKAAASIGVAITAARSDHKHDISTATAGTITVGAAAAEGSATSLARSDHTHALPVPAAPVNVTKAAASAGVATTVARSDHKHDVATAAPGTITVGAAAAEGSSTSLARADHTHALTAPAAPVDITKAAANAGVAVTVARSDHKHDVSTAAPGTITVGAAAAEGVATSLARSDHTHALTAPVAPVDVTKAAASAGAATTVARSDHKHDVATAAPGTIAIGDAALEGSSTSLARADHTHALPTPVAPVDVTKAAASAGVATTVARADHKHDVATAAPATVGTANSEGVSTSLARADHVHAHGNQTSGTLHAAATTSVAGFMSAADKAKLNSIPGSSSLISDIYVSQANGNDANSGASPAAAVQTMAAAVALIPTFPTAPITIHFGTGNYTYANLPTIHASNNAPIYLLGDGAGQPGDTGFLVSFTGTAGVGSTATSIVDTFGSVNDWSGFTIEFTSGALVNQRRTIQVNSTTTLTPVAAFSAAPAPGDTYEIKFSAIQFTCPAGANLGCGTGYGQAESPLVLVNIHLVVASGYDGSLRLTSSHTVLFGVTQRGGAITLSDSTVHAGTLYADASDPYGNFGNFLPFSGTLAPTTYVGTQLAAISANLFNWEGWGFSIPFQSGLNIVPMVVDQGYFVGYLVGYQLTVTAGAGVTLVGGAIIDNGDVESGQVINRGGYLRICKPLTQRLSAGGAIDAPNVRFRIESDATSGAKTALSTLRGGFSLVEALLISTTAGAKSILVSDPRSSLHAPIVTPGISSSTGDITIQDGANFFASGDVWTASSSANLVVNEAQVVFDTTGTLSFATVTVTQLARLRIDAATAFSCNGAFAIVNSQVQLDANTITVAGNLTLDDNAVLTITDDFNFNGNTTITDSKLLVNSVGSTSANLGDVVTLVRGTIDLAAHSGQVRVNQGGAAATLALNISDESKFIQNGVNLAVTGVLTMEGASSWLSRGAIGSTTISSVDITDSMMIVQASSGSLSINNAAATQSWLATNSKISVAGATLTNSAGLTLLQQTLMKVDAGNAALLWTGLVQVRNMSTLHLLGGAGVVTFSGAMTIDDGTFYTTNVGISINSAGDVNADRALAIFGGLWVNTSSEFTITGRVELEAGARWICKQDWGAPVINAGNQSVAFRLSDSSEFNALAAEGSRLDIDTTGVNGVFAAGGSSFKINGSNIRIGNTGAPDFAINFTNGGQIQFGNNNAGLLTSTVADFLDEQGGFDSSIIPLSGAVLTGQHPGGAYSAAGPITGSGFVQISIA